LQWFNAVVTVKTSTAVTAEREPLSTAELTERALLGKTEKSMNIPGRRQQFHPHQYGAGDRSQKGKI
jgi:hypothetical protein